MIDITANEVYFDEMRMSIDDYLALVKATASIEELRFGLAQWKLLQDADRAAA